MILNELFESLRTENPCWKGYHPVGTKKKNGRTVPNCVPNANEGVEEASPEATFNALKGLKSWQVVIMNNYYRGKYPDYSGRYYYVLATSPEEAEQVVLNNADAILQELLAMKSVNGRKILPRNSAIRITADRIGEIRDGTQAGRMTTAGFKKMFSPQGPVMVKLANGAIADVQGQEQGVAEGADRSDMVGFHLDSERAYNAVMSRFGDMIDHDEDSGIMYAPERIWPKIELVAYDADGIGAQRDDEIENPEHYGLDEGGNVFMPGIQNTPEYKAGFSTAKLPVPHPEGSQEYANYYKGVIDRATPNLQKTAEGNDRVGNMDADQFDAAMSRLKKLAGQGPLKTVWDPQKRVYKNVPVAQQPKQQPSK